MNDNVCHEFSCFMKNKSVFLNRLGAVTIFTTSLTYISNNGFECWKRSVDTCNGDKWPFEVAKSRINAGTERVARPGSDVMK